jgi:hypothetical protein
MAGIVFQKMSDAYVPEVLIERVARMVHKDSIAPVLKDITGSIQSSFERLILKNTTFSDIATEYAESIYIYHGLMYTVNYDWVSIIFTRPNNRFVSYNYYCDFNDYEYIVMEGMIDNHNIVITRFHDESRDYRACNDVEIYIKNRMRYFAPFDMIKEIYKLPVLSIKSDGQGHTWSNPKKLYEWFQAYRKDIATIANKMNKIGARSNIPVLNRFIDI